MHSHRPRPFSMKGALSLKNRIHIAGDGKEKPKPKETEVEWRVVQRPHEKGFEHSRCPHAKDLVLMVEFLQEEVPFQRERTISVER